MVAITSGPRPQPFLMWRLCARLRDAWQLRDQAIAAQDMQARQAQAERSLGDPGLARIAHLTLASFDPDLLRVQLGHENPHSYVLDWLRAIEGAAEGDYHRGPPVGLYLYYPGKGTGKTHLAAGATLAARALGKLAVFVEESTYLGAIWAAPFEHRDRPGDTRERLLQLPGDLAWLTAIDDLGQLPPGGEGASKVWYNVINRRWLRRRWTIFTSNYTLDELRARGTINDATQSRIVQMTRGEYVLVEGDDQRQVRR